MKVQGRFGVRLKVDATTLTHGLDEVVAAFSTRVEYVWKLAESEARTDGVADGAVMGRLTFGWSGPDAHSVGADTRKRVERHLRRALGKLTEPSAKHLGPTAKKSVAVTVAQPAPAKPSQPWTSREVEFFVRFGRFLSEAGSALPESTLVNVEALRTRHFDQLEQSVAAVVWVVDIHAPVSWRTLIGELLSRRNTRFGGNVPYYYFWDASRRDDLIGMDRRRLRGKIPELKPPAKLPVGSGDFTLAEGTRFAFVAGALPELKLEDVVAVGRVFMVPVPLRALLDSQFVSGEDFMKTFRLSGDQFESYLWAWADDPPVEVRVVPLTARQRVSVDSLRTLVLEHARRVDAYASRFGRLLLLSRRTLDSLPFELADGVRPLVDAKALNARDAADVAAGSWRPGWQGVFLHPLFQYVPAQAARSKLKVGAWPGSGLSWVKSIASELIRSLTDDEKLAKFVDSLPEDWMLFQLFLDELQRRGDLTLFFDAVRQAKGNAWEWGALRKFKVTRLASQTRHRDHPALAALVESVKFRGFQRSILSGAQHTFELASQSIFLLGDKDQRVQARGNSQDNKRGVVAEVSNYYSETTTVYQPNADLMRRLTEPTRKKVGEFATRMACAGGETMTEQQLIAEAVKVAMKELSPQPEKKDFVPVKMRTSLRVLALEEPVIDGVPQLRIRCEPVTQIGDGPWEATGKPELLTPGAFDARLRVYHVQHMMEALTVFFLAEAVVGGAIVIVAAGIAGIGEVILFIGISEAAYFWTTPKEERSLTGILMTALVAELSLVGFKGLQVVSNAGFRFVAGRAITGEVVGNVVTKWITFALRGTLTASQVGAIGVLELFAHDLFRMTRCRGFSSAEEYWERYKIGFVIGLGFEFIAVPWLAPAARAGLEKASTYLEAARILRGTGKSFGDITASLLRGQKGLEEALGRTLSNPKVTEPLVRGYGQRIAELIKTIGREYESRAYGALFEVLDVKLSAAGREGLSRLLSSRSEREVDRLLQLLHETRLPPAEFLRVVGELDAEALAVMLKGSNLNQLARSPKLLALFRLDGPAALRILRGPFHFSVENCERYLGELERLPAPSRESVFRALFERDPLQPDLLLRAARGLGPLDPTTLLWLRRLHGARIRIDTLFENSGRPFRDFVRDFSRFSSGDQAFVLRIAENTNAANVLRQAERLRTQLAKGAKAIAPTRQELEEQLRTGSRKQARGHVKETFREGPYQTTILDSALADNVRAYAQLKQTMQAFNPDAVYAVDRGGPFVADAITYGDRALTSRIRRWPKPDEKAGWDEALKTMGDEIESKIANGARRFAFTDVYFSGASYNKFQELMERLAQAHPRCEFRGFWIREQIGFEVAGGNAGPVLRVPKASGLSNVHNHPVSVPFAIGDDAKRIVEAIEKRGAEAEPIYVFDGNGVIQRVIEPRPGETTRDLVIRMLNGGT